MIPQIFFQFFGAHQWTISSIVFYYGTNWTIINKSQMNQKASSFEKIVKEHTPACSELLLIQAIGQHSLFSGSFPQ
jgi:hypothetical protein